MSLPFTGDSTPKSECPGFEPQQWRRSVCKNCFRSAERHNKSSASSLPLEKEVEVAASAETEHQPTEHGTVHTRPIVNLY